MVAGGNLGMPVMVEVRTRQSRHGGASVDIVGNTQAPVPRMKKELVYEERKDLPPRPGTKQDATPKADPPKPAKKEGQKEEKAKVKPHEGGGRSERSIQWGTRKEASPPTRAPGAPPKQPEKPTPTIIHEVPAKELRRQDPPGPPTPQEPPRPMEPRDVRIHRVANRVGYVATLKPEETLDLLRKAAARSGTAANTYLEIFAKVGRTHCHRETPDCTPCPLAGKCSFKAKQDARGNGNGKSVLGRFFGRR